MHQLKIKRIAMVLGFVLMPLVTHAAGLGKLRVSSGLGEPLNAEIDVISASQTELDSLEAKIASDVVYASQGVERPSLYNSIRVDLRKKPNGASVLKLTSSEPITEPFLDMLIQMDWGSGQLLREYNLLLDPPGYSKQKNVDVPEPDAVNNENQASTLASETSKAPSPAKVAPAKKITKMVKKAAKTPVANKPVVAVAVPAQAPAGDSFTTKSGDNLTSLAKQAQLEGVSLDQLMVAMYYANQSAFSRKNINRLKVGQILRMPAPELLDAVTPEQAKKEILLRSKDWNTYQSTLAALADSSQQTPEQSAGQTGKIVTKTEDKSQAASVDQRDVIKLSKNDSGTKTADGKSDSSQVNALKDDIASRDNAIKEANIRAEMLEKRVADMEKLLTLKNEAMAKVQNNANNSQTPAAESQSPQTAKTEAVKPTDTSSPEVRKAVTPEPKKVVTAPPADSTNVNSQRLGFIDGLLTDPLMLGAAVGGLLLLGGLWVYIRNRRKRGLDSLEKAILTTGGLKESTVFGSTVGTGIGSGTTSFLTDFSQNSGGMIDTHDVDPIAEAEVYMAYGRDAQAEEILKDAISKDPKRAELHLKLLELYASRKDAQSFETVAGELYSTIGTSDPAWAKAAMLGRSLEPSNPLYQATMPAAESVDEVSPELMFGSGSDSFVEQSEEIEYSSDSLEEDHLHNASSADGFGGLDEIEEPAAMDSTDIASIDRAFREIDENSSQTDMGMDFDLPVQSESEPESESELSSEETPQKDSQQDSIDELEHPLKAQDLTAFASQTQEKLDEISLDLPAMENVAEDGIVASTQNAAAQLDHLNDLDFSTTDEVQPVNPLDETSAGLPEIELSKAEESSLELPALDNDFDGKIDQAVMGSAPQKESADKLVSDSPEIDFSEIDLDLGVKSDKPKDSEASTDDFSMEAESSEVETKLDLVTAYIDMGDDEGAKELLEEVLKEGGPQQRVRAQNILKSLS